MPSKKSPNPPTSLKINSNTTSTSNEVPSSVLSLDIFFHSCFVWDSTPVRPFFNRTRHANEDAENDLFGG